MIIGFVVVPNLITWYYMFLRSEGKKSLSLLLISWVAESNTKAPQTDTLISYKNNKNISLFYSFPMDFIYFEHLTTNGNLCKKNKQKNVTILLTDWAWLGRIFSLQKYIYFYWEIFSLFAFPYKLANSDPTYPYWHPRPHHHWSHISTGRSPPPQTSSMFPCM